MLCSLLKIYLYQITYNTDLNLYNKITNLEFPFLTRFTWLSAILSFQTIILFTEVLLRQQRSASETCLKSKELFAGLDVSLKLTFRGLDDLDSIFVKHIEHVPNAQTLRIKHISKSNRIIRNLST